MKQSWWSLLLGRGTTQNIGGILPPKWMVKIMVPTLFPIRWFGDTIIFWKHPHGKETFSKRSQGFSSNIYKLINKYSFLANFRSDEFPILTLSATNPWGWRMHRRIQSWGPSGEISHHQKSNGSPSPMPPLPGIIYLVINHHDPFINPSRPYFSWGWEVALGGGWAP